MKRIIDAPSHLVNQSARTSQSRVPGLGMVQSEGVHAGVDAPLGKGPDVRLRYHWILIGEQEHSLTGSPWQPQGQGSIATSNTRLPGKLTVAMRG